MGITNGSTMFRYLLSDVESHITEVHVETGLFIEIATARLVFKETRKVRTL